MEVDSKYSLHLVHLGLVNYLTAAADRGAHDLTVQVGNCLCLLMLHAVDDGVLIATLPALRLFPTLLQIQNADLTHMSLRYVISC